ncbi:MAG: sortase [Microgenomates group bacterium]
MRTLLLFISLICLLGAIILVAHRYTPIFTNQPGETIYQESSDWPTHLKLTLNQEPIELLPAQISTDSWEISQHSASVLTNPSFLGLPKTSTIIYGHNWPRLLGNLHNLKVGDTLYIKVNDTWRELYIESSDIVSATELSALSAMDETSVVVYTCTGFLDSKRLVVLAKPAKQHAI